MNCALLVPSSLIISSSTYDRTMGAIASLTVGSKLAKSATATTSATKWSLVSGIWKLDYVLTQGLIGLIDSNLTGPDGPYPAVTTVGLRNLTGVVKGDQVTLWATTSTSSTSGDNGADPNKVVVITDQLSTTTFSRASGARSFASWIGHAAGHGRFRPGMQSIPDGWAVESFAPICVVQTVVIV